MPEKRYVKGCGKSCVRCWQNRLQHGSKLKKKFFPKKFCEEIIEKEDKIVYFSYFEEFLHKYVISNYTLDRINEINSNNMNADEHNRDLISRTTTAYNDWAHKQKGVRKLIKEKDFIKKLNSEVRNSNILNVNLINSKYPYQKEYLESDKFYMFECIY